MADALVRADGNWVVGDRFWDREGEVELLRRRIAEGAHTLIAAPRRIGKTSLMREVARRLAGAYVSLFVDLQGGSSPEDAIATVAAATRDHGKLWRQTKRLFANVLDAMADPGGLADLGLMKVRLRAGLAEGDWRDKGDLLLRALAGSDKRVVLFLDEVAILVSRLLQSGAREAPSAGRARADQFMSWLRANSIQHRGKLTLVVAGSVGLEPVLGQARLSATINTLVPMPLEPWDAPTAQGCLRALANQYGVDFGAGALARIVERLGCCIPHHVQMFFSHLYEFCKRRGDQACSVQDVETVYQRRMLGSRGQAELSHYEERLELVLRPPEYPLAHDLLTEAAVTGHLSPTAAETLARDHELAGAEGRRALQAILGILEHDGYLDRCEEGYRFVSNLLRDWWRGRNESFYVPAAQREA